MPAALLLSLALSLPITLPSGDFPITVSRTGLAPHYRDGIKLATNGRNHLAVWIDQRTERWRLWATRVDAAGSALDGTGIPLGEDEVFSFAVASDGENYAVAWERSGNDGIDLALIDGESGQVQRAPLHQIRGTPLALSWSGNEYTLVYQLYGNQSLFAATFGRDGHLFAKEVVVVKTTGYIAAAEIVSVGGERLVRWLEDRRMYVARIGGPARTAVSDSDVLSLGKLAASGDRLFVVYRTGDVGFPDFARLRARILDANGSPIGAEFDAGEGRPNDNQLSAVWNGQHFLLFTVGTDWRSILVTRFTADGVRIDSVPIPVNGETYDVAAAIAEGQSLFVYSHRRIDSGEPLQWMARPLGETSGGRTISLSAPNTGLPSVVWRGDHYLSVWLDRFADSSDAVFGRYAPDGTPLDAQPTVLGQTFAEEERPSLASDGRDALVVWYVHQNTAPDSIKGTVIKHDGSMVTIDIAESPLRSDVGVSWNGSEYLVVWGSQDGTVWAMRIDSGGKLIDPQPVVIASERAGNRPAIAWDGTRWIVAYQATVPIDPNAPYLQFNLYIHAVQLTRDLTLIGTPLRLSDREPKALRIAVRGSEVFVVWGTTVDAYRVYGSRIANGIPLDPAGGFLIGAGSPAGVRADGDGYVVFEGGGYGWFVRSGQAGIRQKIFPFVSEKATFDLVDGGPRPLVVFRRQPVENESMPQVRAHYVSSAERRRSVHK